uniref:Uncharacterized protein n=1 Tax=Physcomitrium patens TaxID=3218 RepID=A0A2K1JMD3_PHYPA|nr:hypothetical protein PHYPA_017522 [Physcomitrium patens]
MARLFWYSVPTRNSQLQNIILPPYFNTGSDEGWPPIGTDSIHDGAGFRASTSSASCFACPHHNLCALLLLRYLFFSCCDFVLSLVGVVPPRQSLEDVSLLRRGCCGELFGSEWRSTLLSCGCGGLSGLQRECKCWRIPASRP